MSDTTTPDDGQPGTTSTDEPTSGPSGGRSDVPLTAVVLVIVAASAVAAALSHSAPVGVRAVDAVWCALTGGLVAWAASRSNTALVAWLGAVAAVVGVSGGWLAAGCGLAALATGVLVATDRRPSTELAALSGGLAVQALLRGGSYGFLGLPTLVALVAAVPAVVSGFRNSSGTERRVVRIGAIAVSAFVVLATIGAGVAVILARPNLQGAGDHAQNALRTIRAGDLQEATQPLATATSDFHSAAGVLDGPLALAGRAVPILGQHLDALGRVARSGEELTAAVGDASTSDYKKLKADNGAVDLAKVRAMAGPVRRSADALLATEAVVADVRSPWLLPPVTHELDRLSKELVDAAPSAINAADALEVAPTLLGGDGARQYLLQFATPGETRAAGGFIGTYGVLTADNGHLALGLTGSTQELGPEDVPDPDVDPGYAFVPPPGWNDLYHPFYVNHFPGNVSVSPDWPTSSDVARQIYTQVPGIGRTDGVLYADPQALAALLRLTGPVDVAVVGHPLDASNVEQFLYVDQYVQFAADRQQRRGVLGEVASAVFHALTTRPLPAIGELTDALGPVVSSGHLKFVSFDDAAEKLFVRTGLAGAWQTRPGADWLSVRSTNMLPNKIDWFLHREIRVESAIDPTTGAISSTVTVTLRNDAPAGGLPPYLIGNVDGFPDGTNHDALAVYTPHALVALTVDGQPADADHQKGYGGNIFTVPVVIAPGGTATVVYRLEGTVPAGPLYRLDVLSQPLAHDDALSVGLRGTDSEAVTSFYDGPLTTNVQLSAIGR